MNSWNMWKRLPSLRPALSSNSLEIDCGRGTQCTIFSFREVGVIGRPMNPDRSWRGHLQVCSDFPNFPRVPIILMIATKSSWLSTHHRNSSTTDSSRHRRSATRLIQQNVIHLGQFVWTVGAGGGSGRLIP